jgi:4-hydroxy-2-oxoglutarate aldolase
MRDAEHVAARLRGILGPVVTPFEPRSGDVDRAAFEANLRAHLAAGLRGVVVAGSTGEAALLDEAERAALVASARSTLADDALVIAGAGAESTRATLRLARQAAEGGAEAVLVVAPHYYGEAAMTHAALAAHYERIADASPVPVVLYNIPKYAHFALPPALVRDLARHENVVGIKDSSGDLELLGAYLTAQSTTFRVLTGHAGTFRAALERGVAGGILAVSLFAPRLSLEVYDSAQRGDWAAAGRAQERLGPLGAQVVGALGVPGVKAAMDAVGLAGGPPRAPLLPLRGADRERVAGWLRAAAQPVAA